MTKAQPANPNLASDPIGPISPPARVRRGARAKALTGQHIAFDSTGDGWPTSPTPTNTR